MKIKFSTGKYASGQCPCGSPASCRGARVLGYKEHLSDHDVIIVSSQLLNELDDLQEWIFLL